MRCFKVRSLLSAYLDDMLDINETRMVKDHLRHCAFCTRELEDLKYCRSIMYLLEEPVLPEGFAIDLHRKLIKLS